MKSLSEIETTSKRASRAIGFPWGIAEEVGKSIRLLELFGFQGIKSLNQYYESKNKENFENIRYIEQVNSSNKIPFCPILLGISFLDQVKSLETFKKCSFKEIAYPLLFLPFLSRSSEIVGKKILFTFDGINFLLNFNINISSSLFDTKFPLIAKNSEVIFMDNRDNFSDLEWKNLYRLSENTFVKETESLKKGAAGAGLTDND
tara:strand:- start:71 stop:682 length:612 start_codon:yes stop_codon:yes gene_type:complete